MTDTAIALVLVSALLHATWNFFNKGSPDRWAFFFAQGVLTAVCYAPFALGAWPAERLPVIGWLWITASAVAHAGYAVFLLKAYDAGDLSVAYPLSRTAPILVVGWDLLTARAHLSPWGVLGALLAGCGAVTLQMPALGAHGGRAVFRAQVTRYALTAAVFIAAFTIVDKQGVRWVPPLLFLYLVGLGEFSLIGWRLGRAVVPRAWDEVRTNTRAVVFTALLGPFSYLLILWVLRTAPASYVLGLRQTSIVFGVLLGRFVLGEGEAVYRFAGATIITVGSVLIAAGG